MGNFTGFFLFDKSYKGSNDSAEGLLGCSALIINYNLLFEKIWEDREERGDCEELEDRKEHEESEESEERKKFENKKLLRLTDT